MVFFPNRCSNITKAFEYREYQNDPEARKFADEMESALKGESKVSYEQTSWMWRGCYKDLPGGGYLMGKGTGPWEWSEKMRELLDAVWKMRTPEGFQGGCMRMSLGLEYPILLQFSSDDRGWRAIDPRPEGFAIFWALFREGVSGELYRLAGVPCVVPVALYRNKIVPPFQITENSEWIERYIRDHFFESLSEYAGGAEFDSSVPIRFEETTYFDMDGWILVRKAKTPFRIANLHTALVEKDFETARKMKESVIGGFAESGDSETLPDASREFRLARVLGTAAGKLFTNNIVHGQLNIHFQNVSLLGELADFDSSVFLGAYCEWLEGRVLPSSAEMKAWYARLQTSILDGEKDFGVVMRPFFQEDFERTVGGVGFEKADGATLCSNIVGQIYDLFNQALRWADLFVSVERNPDRKGGTILLPSEIDTVRNVFLSSMLAEIRTEEASDHLSRVLRSGKERFLRSYLPREGGTTIYGWHFPEAPFNHLDGPCDAARADFIREDASVFLSRLEEALTSNACPK